MINNRQSFVALVLAASACIEIGDKDRKKAAADSDSVALAADSLAISTPSWDTLYTDTVGLGQQYAQYMTPASESTFKLITPSNAAAKPTRFPLVVPTRGTIALQLQILLDRAGFSPGIIDGTWGNNATKALRWFNAGASGDTTTSTSSADSMRANVDRALYNRLVAAAGSTPLVSTYTVTADDVKGPFTKIPDRVYDQAKLSCLCYSSAAELLAERFHTSPQLLAQLNPGVNFASVTAGATISVPNVRATDSDATDRTASRSDSNLKAPRDSAAGMPSGIRIVISKKEFWTHLVDATGNVIRHFPSTLGAGYDPSPTGEFHVTSISQNPTFRYDPKLFAEVPDTRPTAKLPAGPNSPVGVVWIALSKPHYGIHGTASPESIGYQSSHGCVRLTNWDARALADLVSSGTPVTFQN
jgi:lipoprotein-anchoring transpeptidase ErfK/SrfK